jgi:hypothetical protein
MTPRPARTLTTPGRRLVAGVALDVDDVFTGVDPDVDEGCPDVFVRDATSPHSGVDVSCNGPHSGVTVSWDGNVEDVVVDGEGGRRHYCRAVG